ncbi:MAG: F0F1 ATP synthase subunit delta [Rhodocyclaceae bacterium]|nr:F0F1 ATP synthase subunit delta [Rhodocyclaceae bacterium]
MAEIATIARPYAEAAFRLAREQGRLADWSDVLGRMAQVADAARPLIGHPNVADDALEDLFRSACGDMDVEAGNFLKLLIENDRLTCLSEIAEQFEALKRQDSGIKEAAIHSAFPMDDAQAQSLKALLENRFQTPLKISVVVTPELIGGIKAVVGDQVLDTSVRGKLDAMAVALNS